MQRFLWYIIVRIIELQQWSDFLREFDIYRLALEKTAVSIMVCQQDKSDYEAKLSEIEERIDKVKLSITELKSTLVEDRRIRMQKDEYESIARLIHQLPSRSDTEQVILKLEMEIAELNAVEESLILETTSRQRDFSVLFHSLSALSKDAVPLDEKAAAGETVITQ